MSLHWLVSRSVTPTETKMGKALRIMPAPSRKFDVRFANPSLPAASKRIQRDFSAQYGDVCAAPHGQEPRDTRTVNDPEEAGADMAEQSATGRTVLIAGAANVFVGAIKLVAGILVGSSAMLAEAAHSAADTLNQVFLWMSLRRGARPADARHPFGYGQERYFWSLLAAFGIFIAGAGFSIFEGLLALSHENSGSPLLAFLVLAAAGIAEGISLVRVLVQYRREARSSHTEMLDEVRSSPDTTVRTTLFEDSAAMVGLVLAALGLTLRQVTGSPVWDGGASIAIGVLLVVIAVRLGMDHKDFLIGRAAGPKELGD